MLLLIKYAKLLTGKVELLFREVGTLAKVLVFLLYTVEILVWEAELFACII